MKVFDKNLPVFLIRVFQQKDYRTAFINGHIYLHEAGYYNKLEDGFRGDEYDSKIVQTKQPIIINGVTFTPDIIIQGFVGDDKIPILCTTIINEQCLFINAENRYQIKREIIHELKKFGNYGVLFFYGELINNLNEYAVSNDILIDQDIVKYCNLGSEHCLSLYKGDLFNKYFIKDSHYKNQNELRFIFLSNNKNKFTPLVPQNQDHIEIDIKPLKNFCVFNLESDFLFNLGF